jgi:hypothetical protein
MNVVVAVGILRRKSQIGSVCVLLFLLIVLTEKIFRGELERVTEVEEGIVEDQVSGQVVSGRKRL